MSRTLSKKQIWLVGASFGIGRALAEALAERDNMVFVTARSEASLHDLQSKYPNRISCIPGDITDPEQLENIKSTLNQNTDLLDMLILCAGTCEYDDGAELNTEMYRRVFDLNFFATVDCTRVALPLLEKSKGEIVALSSLAIAVPFPRAEAYGASKAALEYFMKSLKIDLLTRGVGVSLVRPGFVDTPLTQKNDFPMPMLMSPTEAANEIIKGLEHNKSMISFPWKLRVSLRIASIFENFWAKIAASRFTRAKDI